MEHAKKHYIDLLEQYELTKTDRARQRLLNANPEFLTQDFALFLDDFISSVESLTNDPNTEIKAAVEYQKDRLRRIRVFLADCRTYGIDTVYLGLQSGIASRLQHLLTAPSWVEKRPILDAELDALTSDIADEILSKGVQDAKTADAKRAVRDLGNHRLLLAHVRNTSLADVAELMDQNQILHVSLGVQKQADHLEQVLESVSGNPELINHAAELARTLFLAAGQERALPPAQLYISRLCHSAFLWAGIRYIDDRIEVCESAISEIHPNIASRCAWLVDAASSHFAKYQESSNDDIRLQMALNQAIDISEDAIRLAISSGIDLGNALVAFTRMRLTRAHELKTLADIGRAETFIEFLLKRGDSLDIKELVGACHLERFNITKEPAELESASQEFAKVLTLVKPGSKRLGVVHINLANVFLSRFALSDRSEDLKSAVDHLHLAIPAASGRLDTLEHDVAVNLLHHYPVSGDLEELDEAVVILRRLELAEQSKIEDKRTILDHLARALWLRYHHRGSLQDLEDAIRFFHAAASLPRVSSVTPESALNNLAAALRDLSLATGSERALRSSIELHRKAVDLTPQGSSERAAHLNNFGLALLQQVISDRSHDVLLEAVSALRQAVALTPPDSSDYPNHVSVLASGLRRLYEANGDRASLDEAIELWESVLKDISAKGRLKQIAGLAHALRLRSDLSGSHRDIEQAREHFRTCLRSWAIRAPGAPGAIHAIELSEVWGVWALRRDELAEATEAYGYGIAALKDLVRLQTLRRHKEAAAKVPVGFIARAAYAFARHGDIETAADALESGRTFLFNEGLDLAMHELARLKEFPEYEQLHKEFQDSAQILRTLQLENKPAETSEQSVLYTKTRRKFDTLIEKVRRLEGFERFLQPYNVSEITSAASELPIIYLAAAEGTCLAIIAETDGSLRPVWLPPWNRDSLLDAIAREHTNAHQLRYKDPQRWMAAQRELALRLWDSFMEPLLPEIKSYSRVVLIPTGLMSLFPLHAAAVADDSQPSGYRYALDEMVFSYAPNARSIAVARTVAERAVGHSILAVDNPNSHHNLPLFYSAYETAAAIGGALPTSYLVLRGAEATTQAVMKAMHSHPIQHFSCHGKSLYRSPLKSHLLLAGDDKLTLGDILEQQLGNVRLAVLSACESAVPGQDLIDEAISLPSGLLQAGVAGVIASMWDVNELSTMELMVRFYDALNRGKTAPCGLRLAQQLVRDTTIREKTQYLNARLTDWIDPWMTLDGDERIFGHVAYWGAFAHFGL